MQSFSYDPLKMYGIIFPILILIGYYFGRHIVLKSLLENFRICIDNVDDALKDNNVSEEEFNKIWDTCYKKIIDYLPYPPKNPPAPPQK